MAPVVDESLEIEAEHAALLAIAKPLRVSVNINRKARRAGRPHVELFHRRMLLAAFRNFNDAAAWLRPVQPQEASR